MIYKKVLFLGNVINDTGPSVVNKNLKQNLEHEVIFLDSKSKFIKLKIFILNVFTSDVIVCSGIGFINILGAIVGFFSGARVVYLMHGAIKLEIKYRDYSKIQKFYEYILISISNTVITVSEHYRNKLLSHVLYNKFCKKIVVVQNGFDATSSCSKRPNERGKIRKIISVGGGRKEKNIISICKGIALMPEGTITLTVVGPDGTDTDEIKSFPFVDYKGIVKQKDLFDLYMSHDLYIQFSYLESFGLAPIEAVQFGCDLLLSSEVGIAEFIPSRYVISPNDIDSLSTLIFCSNNHEIVNTLRSSIISWQTSSQLHIKEWCRNC